MMPKEDYINGEYEVEKKRRTSWNIEASKLAEKAFNKIRYVMEELKIEPNPELQMIPLSIGDPTTFGNLHAPPNAIEALKEALISGKYNGYTHTTGSETARQAVADYVSPFQGPVESNDVILCSGCSNSLEMAIISIGCRGTNILVPRPGFPLYTTLAASHDIETRLYDLLPEHNWEIDLAHMQSLIDEKTVGIVITNPSNPCGSVFSRRHLIDILNIAEKYYLPIIADEIYEKFVFPGVEYVALSAVSQNVPILSCGGLTKRFLVPGWRMGWIVIHDRNGVLVHIRKALTKLCGRTFLSNSLVQGALPQILKTPDSFFTDLTNYIYNNATIAFTHLNQVKGLKPVMPQGAMYMMIGIEIDKFPNLENELDFVQALVKDQSVFCLPGQCFNYPNYFRIVLTVPEEMIDEACRRIELFVAKTYKDTNSNIAILDNNELDKKPY